MSRPVTRCAHSARLGRTLHHSDTCRKASIAFPDLAMGLKLGFHTVYPHVQPSLWEKTWKKCGKINSFGDFSKPLHPVITWMSRKSTIYFAHLSRFKNPTGESPSHGPHGSGALLPATGAEQGIEPRADWCMSRSLVIRGIYPIYD